MAAQAWDTFSNIVKNVRINHESELTDFKSIVLLINPF